MKAIKDFNKIKMNIKKLFLFATTAFLLANCRVSYPQDSDGNLDLGYKYLNSGKLADAIQIFEDYIKTHPGDLKIYLQLAYAYKQAGNKQEAKDYFNYVALCSDSHHPIISSKTP